MTVTALVVNATILQPNVVLLGTVAMLLKVMIMSLKLAVITVAIHQLHLVVAVMSSRIAHTSRWLRVPTGCAAEPSIRDSIP